MIYLLLFLLFAIVPLLLLEAVEGIIESIAEWLDLG